MSALDIAVSVALAFAITLALVLHDARARKRSNYISTRSKQR